MTFVQTTDRTRQQNKSGKPKARATLAQIAKASGFSISTVSAVLNDRSDCWASKTTREHVIQIAHEMDYRPNLLARSLQGGKTWTLGMLTAALDVEVSTARVQVFETAARNAGYITMMTFSPNDDRQEDRLVASLLDRGVDGLVVYPAETGEHVQLRRAIELGVPVVTIDGRGRAELECDDVSMDYHTAGALQARHLMELGYRRLVQVTTSPNCYTKDQLQRGFLDELAKAGQPQPMVWSIPNINNEGATLRDDFWQDLAELMRQHRGQFDAMASTDEVAVAALRAAYELGWRVPDELAIIGSDGTSTASNGPIPLTTVAQPVEKIGLALFEVLNQRIESSSSTLPPQRLLFEPDLITRATTLSSATKKEAHACSPDKSHHDEPH